MQTELNVEGIKNVGFIEVGCWTASGVRLNLPEGVPLERGVYAFALEERVLYVGLASRSLKKRLSFYSLPGVSQRTNVRVNGLIRESLLREAKVRIFIARPPDFEWNGMRISGSEGLEAALIEDFDLPWNIRGRSTHSLKISDTISSSDQASLSLAAGERRKHGSVPQEVLNFVKEHPGCTELQIAVGVFGPDATQPHANPYCRRLVLEGLLKKSMSRPATYEVASQELVEGTERPSRSGVIETPTTPNGEKRLKHGTIRNEIIKFIGENPGCTELQIAHGIFGPNGVQPKVNPHCRRLVMEGRVKRSPTWPATYEILESEEID